MARRTLLAGDTSVIVPVFVQDSTSTTGGGLGSLVYNTSGLTCKYKRRGDSGYTTVTLATATIGTWATGGFKEDTSGPTGSYELHLPNAAVASGAKWVVVELYGAANMVPVKIDIELVAYNPQDAVRLGLTALPNAAAGVNTGLPVVGTQIPNASASATGGLPTVDASNAVKVQSGTGANQLNLSGGVVDANVTKNAGTAITSAAGRQEVNVTHSRGSALAVPTTAGVPKVEVDAYSSQGGTQLTGNVGLLLPTNFASLGINASGHISRVTLADTLTTYTGNTPQTGDAYARLGAPAGASVSADVAAVTTHLTDLKGSGWVTGDNFHTRLGATPPTAAAIRTEINSNGNHVKVGTAYTHTNNSTAATANVTIS